MLAQQQQQQKTPNALPASTRLIVLPVNNTTPKTPVAPGTSSIAAPAENKTPTDQFVAIWKQKKRKYEEEFDKKETSEMQDWLERYYQERKRVELLEEQRIKKSRIETFCNGCGMSVPMDKGCPVCKTESYLLPFMDDIRKKNDNHFNKILEIEKKANVALTLNDQNKNDIKEMQKVLQMISPLEKKLSEIQASIEKKFKEVEEKIPKINHVEIINKLNVLDSQFQMLSNNLQLRIQDEKCEEEIEEQQEEEQEEEEQLTQEFSPSEEKMKEVIHAIKNWNDVLAFESQINAFCDNRTSLNRALLQDFLARAKDIKNTKFGKSYNYEIHTWKMAFENYLLGNPNGRKALQKVLEWKRDVYKNVVKHPARLSEISYGPKATNIRAFDFYSEWRNNLCLSSDRKKAEERLLDELNNELSFGFWDYVRKKFEKPFPQIKLKLGNEKL